MRYRRLGSGSYSGQEDGPDALPYPIDLLIQTYSTLAARADKAVQDEIAREEIRADQPEWAASATV